MILPRRQRRFLLEPLAAPKLLERVVLVRLAAEPQRRIGAVGLGPLAPLFGRR